jgi:hypothetical protein
MSERTITGDCSSCESSYEVSYMEELTSEDLPEFCPFCGETIDAISESEYIEDTDYTDKDEWDN